MTQQQHQHSCRIALRADNQGARPVLPSQGTLEKLATEKTKEKEKEKTKVKEKTTKIKITKLNILLKTKQLLTIGTLNVQTLRKQEKIG